MINVNFTLILQLINFIILMWFLNKFLFKPILKVLDERDKKIKGDIEVSDSINSKVGEGLLKLSSELKQAKIDSNILKNSIIAEGIKSSNVKIEAAKNQAKQSIDKLKAELEKNRQVVESEMEKDVSAFAKMISSNLIGRQI